MKNRLVPVAMVMVLVLGAGRAAFAQSGVIQGRVLDPQGGAVADARAQAFDEIKGRTVREASSGAEGFFTLHPLLPGTYTVKVEQPGFKPVERRGLVLDPNQVIDLGRVVLEVGAVTAEITVQAPAPLVETGTAQKSFVIAPEQVTELQVNGRNFDALIKTLPGVTASSVSDFSLGFSGTNSFSVNGGRTSMNNVYLDGAANLDAGDNGSQYTQLSLDAVAEFKVQTSTFNAEYGRNTGVLISVVTKSGGKDFHGAVWEFNRGLDHNKLDAKNGFNGVKQTVKLDSFGANLGGWLPIPGVSTRDDKKVFFFVNYEGTRGQRPNGNPYFDVFHPDVLRGDLSRFLRPGTIAGTSFPVGTVFRPGTIVRNAAGNIIGGVPYPGNIIPPSEWSRNAQAFLRMLGRIDRTGAPETPGSPQFVRVPGGDTYRLRKNQEAVRIDYNISSKTNLFFRFVNDFQHEEQGLGIFTSTPFPVYPMLREKPGQSWSLNLVNMLSPRMANEVIVAYTHQSQVVDVVDGTDPSTYDRDALGFTFGQLFPAANIRSRFPRFDCGASCGFGGFPSNWENDGKDYGIWDHLTYARGAHTFKTGLYLNMDDKVQQPAWNDAGTFNFNPSPENPMDTGNAFANLLLGNYTTLTQDNGKFLGKFRFYGFEAYLQDTWKVRPRLTLEYGARYVFLGPTFTRGDILAYYFDPDRYDPSRAVQIDTRSGRVNSSIVPGSGDPINGMVREGSPGVPAGFVKHRTNQVAPRLGFAWDVTGDGKTAIRGGGGVFFERIRQNVNNFDGLANPPVLDSPQLGAGNVDAVSSALVAGGTRFPPTIKAMDKNGFIPTSYQWSFGVQRQLPGKALLDVAYVGNTYRHLQFIRNINNLPPGTSTSSPILAGMNNTAAALRPYKGYQGILLTEYGANSNYHALQVRLSRRFAQGFTANVNYTLSRALTQFQSDDSSAIVDAGNRGREWGPTQQDRRHVLTIDYVYKLPRLGGGSGIGQFFLNGWEISGITRFWSGRPYDVTSNGNAGTLSSGTSPTASIRADYLGGPIYPDRPTRDQWFNPFVFARPADGQLGNTPRNFIRGPGVNNWDVSLFKNFDYGRVRAQLRLEAFNAWNHPQFGDISAGISVPNPGQAVTPATVGSTGRVTNFRDPRTIQLGLKLYF